MRQSLTVVRERILVALRAACAQSAATAELLERLEEVDMEIVDELISEVEEANAWASRTRAKLERAVADARQVLNGGIWEVKSGRCVAKKEESCKENS